MSGSEVEERAPLKTFHCLRCGYTWPQRFPEIVPKNCANRACKSPNWDRPRSERKPKTWQSAETKASAARKPKQVTGITN